MIPAGKRGYSFFLRGLERLAILSRDHHIGELPGVSLFLTLCRGCVPVISQFSTSEGFSTLEDFFLRRHDPVKCLPVTKNIVRQLFPGVRFLAFFHAVVIEVDDRLISELRIPHDNRDIKCDDTRLDIVLLCLGGSLSGGT